MLTKVLQQNYQHLIKTAEIIKENHRYTCMHEQKTILNELFFFCSYQRNQQTTAEVSDGSWREKKLAPREQAHLKYETLQI